MNGAGGAVDPNQPDAPSWIGGIDPDQCYWAVMPPSPQGLRGNDALRFEAYLPCPVDGLQCAFTVLPDGRIMGCAAERQVIASMRDGPGGARLWTIRPLRLPSCVGASGVTQDALADMNLLGGSCPSHPVRRARRSMRMFIAAGLLSAAVVVAAVGEPLTRAWQQAASALESEREAIAERIVPAGSSPLPAQARLLQAYRQAIKDGGQQGASISDALLVIDAMCAKLAPVQGIVIADVHADQQRLHATLRLASFTVLQQLTTSLPVLESPDGRRWRMEPLDVPAGRREPMTIAAIWTAEMQGQGR